jgi:hypothetical protein
MEYTILPSLLTAQPNSPFAVCSSTVIFLSGDVIFTGSAAVAVIDAKVTNIITNVDLINSFIVLFVAIVLFFYELPKGITII